MLLPLILLACGSSEPPAPTAADAPQVPAVGFTLAYSANVDGEIEPCG